MLCQHCPTVFLPTPFCFFFFPNFPAIRLQSLARCLNEGVIYPGSAKGMLQSNREMKKTEKCFFPFHDSFDDDVVVVIVDISILLCSHSAYDHE
jgi:hypothetical protein